MVVLIVDSSIDIIERLEEILTETTMSHTVYTAMSYQDAMPLYMQHRPDAVFVDTGLPGDYAILLLSAIKKMSTTTAVIMISIMEDVLTEEKCRLLGADFFCDLFHHYGDIPGIMDRIAANILQRGS